MLDFQQKRKVRKILYSKVTLCIVVLLVLLLVHSTYGVYQKEKLSATALTETANEYNSLKDRETMLNSEISKLNTDAGLEEEIRSKFSVAKPGETVVTVLGGSGNATSAANASSKGFWQSILSWF
jgi:cell division protein FtsB